MGQRQQGRHWRRAVSLGPTLRPGNHLNRTYQQASQQSTSRHSNDILARGLESKKPIDWPRIPLVIIMTFESLQRNIKVYVKGLWRCLLLKVRTKAMWWPQVITGTDLSIKRYIQEFDQRTAYFYQLKRQSRLWSMPPALRKLSSTYSLSPLPFRLNHYQ